MFLPGIEQYESTNLLEAFLPGCIIEIVLH